jgi:hypothetical protein
MDADLIPDTERWESERRASAAGGQPSNGISLRDSDGIVRSNAMASSTSGFNNETTASGYFAL